MVRLEVLCPPASHPGDTYFRSIKEKTVWPQPLWSTVGGDCHGQEHGHAQAGFRWPPQLLWEAGVWEEASGEEDGRVRGWWEGLLRKCPVFAPYLRLRPHERKSHAAFEEVRFQQFTGNAHFLLKEKKYQQMGWLHKDRCVEVASGGTLRLQQIRSFFKAILRQ